MTFRIPKKIRMGGQTVRVRVMKNIHAEGAIGSYKDLANEIQVQTHVDGSPMPDTKVEQTFWHEYAHCLLAHCRREDLNADENLVDLMGEFLHQSLGDKLK